MHDRQTAGQVTIPLYSAVRSHQFPIITLTLIAANVLVFSVKPVGILRSSRIYLYLGIDPQPVHEPSKSWKFPLLVFYCSGWGCRFTLTCLRQRRYRLVGA
jgi:hypothetical protein